jgi:hypothetical protein
MQTPAEQLQERIAQLQKALQELLDLRDVPGKREEIFDQVRAKNPVAWDESAVAINGGWIKAATVPPSGLEPVQILLIRKGKVIETMSSTLAKLSYGYDDTTGKYSPSPIHSGFSGSAWGVKIDTLSLGDAIDTTLEVGDCAVLRVSPRLCEGGRLIH